MKGIIYKATNLVTNKIYIGQTKRSLHERIKGHYDTAINGKFKFCKALRKYNKDDWKWEIIEEADIESLDTLEIKYIAKFDTYKNGYNSTLGGGGVRGVKKDSKIYEIYHPDTGILKLSRQDLYKLNFTLGQEIRKLVNKKTNHIKGYVLAEYKDNYDSLVKISHLYHPDYGIISASFTEFKNKYFNGSDRFKNILYGKSISFRGWVTAKNKDNYNKIFNILTLEHPEYGKHTLSGKEFTKQFSIPRGKIHFLKIGRIKVYKGWKLVTDI